MANLPSPTEVNIYFELMFLSGNELTLWLLFPLRKYWPDKEHLKFCC